MADSEDLQALENISNEVDSSQVKISISSHCMKAQTFLLDKLRKQAQRQEEICKFISSSNLKLETEIKLAEQEIKSLNVAIETIKLGNIELNKEHMLSKERKTEIFERTKIGKKKYENLWLTSKERYENIPIVKKLIDVRTKNQTVQANISALINESKRLASEIKTKRSDLEATDRGRIIQLAEYFVRERTKMLLKINENNAKIKEVANEVERLEKEASKKIYKESEEQSATTDREQAVESAKDSILEDNWCNLRKNSSTDPLVLPKLHLQNNDLDIFSIKLDQMNKVDSTNTTSIKRSLSSTLSSLEENRRKTHKSGERDNESSISSYFDIPLDSARNDDKNLSHKNYSEKKLIHILEDIKLDKNEAYELMKKVEVKQFEPTKCITSKSIQQFEKNSNTQDETNRSKSDEKIQSVETEDKDEKKLQNVREEDVVDPPSQFLDASQRSQEKKVVSFNIPDVAEVEMSGSLEEVSSNPKDIDKSQEKILNISTASDDSYTTIKEKMLRKRNLDLSPQFMYSVSTRMHKQPEEKATSKFFESQNKASPFNDMDENEQNKKINQEQILKCDENKSNLNDTQICTTIENVVVSSPKGEIKNLEVPVVGFLFNHGAQGITDSLNLSVSTTGFEDNEDFPHCIDSSVLLSPKADIPASVSSSNNHEVLSQEVPNFLGGFRKTALSFFGTTNTSDSKPVSSEPQSGGFNFAFGNEEKKGRGGFFSMFH